jgi:hypothetical protein
MQRKSVDERFAKYHYDLARARALYYPCRTSKDLLMVNSFLDPIMRSDAKRFVENVWNDAAWERAS